MNEEAHKTGKPTGKLKVLLLLAIFLLPLIAANVLYLSGWRPEKTVNYGDLVQPPRTIADMELQLLEGKAIRFNDLLGKWSLVYFGTAECLSPCEDSLYKMRQVREAQGKKKDHVQRLFVVTDAAALDLLRYILRDYPGMHVITGPQDSIVILAKVFTLPEGSPYDDLHRVYIIDPFGNFMLSYPADADPSGMRKDLVRLLKVSNTG